MNPYDPPNARSEATNWVGSTAIFMKAGCLLGIASTAMLHFSTWTTTYSPYAPGVNTITVSKTVTTLTPVLNGGIILGAIASLLLLSPFLRLNPSKRINWRTASLLLVASSFFGGTSIYSLFHGSPPL